jgi:hypothetical protein
MADDITKPDAGEKPPVPVENRLAEFQRKIDGLAEINQRLATQLETMNKKPAAPAAKEESLDDILYNKGAEALAQVVEQRAEKRIEKRLAQAAEAQSAKTSTINQLYNEFPELADSEHPLTKASLERYGKMSATEQADPKSLRLAALETAMEMDVKPRSKRGDDDSFAMPASTGQPTSRRRNTSDKLDPAMLEFAERCGLNVRDPKVVENIKKRAARQNWDRYQSVNED